MQIESTSGSYRDLDVQALAIAVFKGEKADDGFLKDLDSITGGVIKSVLDSEELKGKESETVYVHLIGNSDIKAHRLLLVGVGERSDYTAAEVSQMAGTAVRALRGKNVKSIAVVPRREETPEDIVSMAVEGSVMALFDADETSLKRGVERGRIVGESVNFTRDLANEPGAYMTPTNMSERAREVATEFGLSIDVLDEARMEQEGMGSLLSVSRGSEEPAKLIILKYTPSSVTEGNEKLLAFVGKGITFDSGGISLKPGENMELMKYDMTGGATVMGAMRAIAQLRPSIPVLGVVTCSEN